MVQKQKNHFLLESLAACQGSSSKLTMYFTVNSAFVNYLKHFPNLTESLDFPIIKNKTTFEQTLPISLNVSKFSFNLLTAPFHLKDFIHRYTHNKDIFNLNERHATIELENTNKNFFSNNHIMDIFLFITALISLLVTNLAIYLLCKHKKLRTLVTSLALQQVKEVGAVTQKEIMQKEINSEWKTITYISVALTILGLVMVAILHYKKS